MRPQGICFFSFVCVAGMAAAVRAQCDTEWLPGTGVSGVLGTVHALTEWDPDGAGPAPRVLVAGGTFVLAGSVQVSNLAAWDPASGTWSALGGGVNHTVRALATLPTGELGAAGIC
jgi:hypothetical protein